MPLEAFTAFVTRAHVPEKERVIVWGDIHGSYTGLVSALTDLANGEETCLCPETLHISRKCRFVVLGDFVDRGERSVDVCVEVARFFLFAELSDTNCFSLAIRYLCIFFSTRSPSPLPTVSVPLFCRWATF